MLVFFLYLCKEKKTAEERLSGSPVLASKGAAALCSSAQHSRVSGLQLTFLLQGPSAAQRGPCPCLTEGARPSTCEQASIDASRFPVAVVGHLLSAKDTVSDSLAFFILILFKYNGLGVITAIFKI